MEEEEEMNSELKGIKLKEDVGNVGFNEEEEEEDFDDMK